jgi:hypothetical protein
MSDRSRLGVLLSALLLVAALLSFEGVGPHHRPDVKCVLLGSQPLTSADIKDFHLPPDDEAQALRCASDAN